MSDLGRVHVVLEVPEGEDILQNGLCNGHSVGGLKEASKI